MVARPALAAYEERVEPRDETLHRTRMEAMAGSSSAVMIVNLSPNGFMARCADDVTAGEQVTVMLPVVGAFAAEVRWALGGRIGCRLRQEIPPALYQFVLAAMREGASG